MKPHGTIKTTKRVEKCSSLMSKYVKGGPHKSGAHPGQKNKKAKKLQEVLFRRSACSSTILRRRPSSSSKTVASSTSGDIVKGFDTVPESIPQAH